MPRAPKTLKDASIHELADELRSRGCPLVLWQAEDVADRFGGDEDAAWDALDSISRDICDRMTETGWGVIDDLIPRKDD